VASAQVSRLADNLDFRPSEALAGLEVTGAPQDISAWRFRKAIQLARGGAQQIELDLQVLSRAQSGLQDLRVMRGSNQVPYLVQHTSIRRALTPMVTSTNDAKDPKLSRWIIQLPQSSLPLSQLTCSAKTPLFQRETSLFEELTDERGDKFHVTLGTAAWTQTPESKAKEFSIPINQVARSDKLFLETENGDNRPIELEGFRLFYPATRLLFKAKQDERLYLYYGNPQAASPRYDLSLVATELIAAEKAPATAASEERLRKPSWAEGGTTGSGGIVFWGILAVVVIGLLGLIARLLPKAPGPPAA
jgi:hypothetical protein